MRCELSFYATLVTGNRIILWARESMLQCLHSFCPLYVPLSCEDVLGAICLLVGFTTALQQNFHLVPACGTFLFVCFFQSISCVRFTEVVLCSCFYIPCPITDYLDRRDIINLTYVFIVRVKPISPPTMLSDCRRSMYAVLITYILSSFWRTTLFLKIL